MKAGELLTKAPVTVLGAVTLRDAAALMESANVGHHPAPLPVVP